MTKHIEITVVGNLTADPELRYTQNGLAVANFTIAATERVYDREAGGFKDGDATFLRATVWREMAEHVASSFSKGQHVIATGKLKQNNYETKEGEKRTSLDLEIDEIGGSVRFGTTTFTKSAPGNQNTQGAVPVAAQTQAQPQPQAVSPQAQPQPQQSQAPVAQPNPAPQPTPVPAGVATSQTLDDDAF